MRGGFTTTPSGATSSRSSTPWDQRCREPTGWATGTSRGTNGKRATPTSDVVRLLHPGGKRQSAPLLLTASGAPPPALVLGRQVRADGWPLLVVSAVVLGGSVVLRGGVFLAGLGAR